jgi:hypothetical protein
MNDQAQVQCELNFDIDAESFQNRRYHAVWKHEEQPFLTDNSLRGLVARLPEAARSAVEDFHVLVEASDNGGEYEELSEADQELSELPLQVPLERFAHQVDGVWVLRNQDDVPAHWRIPQIVAFKALDKARGINITDSSYDGLVVRLRQHTDYGAVKARTLHMYLLMVEDGNDTETMLHVVEMRPWFYLSPEDDDFEENTSGSEDDWLIKADAEVELARPDSFTYHFFFAYAEKLQRDKERLARQTS